MADGKVVIKATLDGSDAQSGVSKLKGLLGGLQQTGSRVGSVFKSVLGANLVSSALTSGLSAVSSGVRGIIDNLNDSTAAWASFEGNMKNLGVADAEIKQVSASLQDYAKKTIYSSSEMASTYAQLRATGVEGTEDLVKAFGNLAGSAENPAQAMKTLSQQATQMTANSKVQFADFRIMAQQAPSAMAEVAKKMGMTYGQLTTAIKDGKVATTDFFEAVKQAGAAGSVFEDMATKPKSIAQAFDTLIDGISNKLLPKFRQFNQAGIDFITGIADAVENLNFDGIFAQFDGLVQGFKDLGVFDNFKATLSSIGETFKSVFQINFAHFNTGVVTVTNILNGLMYVVQDIAFGISGFFQGFSNSGAVRALALAFYDLSVAGLDLSEKLSGAIPWEKIGSTVGQVVKFLAEVVSAIAQFSQSIDGNIFRGLLIGIPAAIVAFKVFNFLKGFNPFSFFKKNATDGADGATNAVRRSKSTISQLFTGLSNVIKSSGTAIKTAAVGIGTGIKTALSGVGPVLRAFGAMLKTAGVANILAFGGAIAIAAVGIGAGLAIISAGLTLLATQSQGISTILQAVSGVIVSVGTAIGTILNMALEGLANALVIVAPVLPTIASAFAQLSPLITAAGVAISMIISAFSSLAPVITALGSALSQVISAISSGVAEIARAVTPIVGIISGAFVQIVQIVTDAIVQIIQALAPFIPAVTEMVIALAPVLQSMVEAFNNLISQIAPILTSLSELITSFAEGVKLVLDGAKVVIDSLGGAIRSALDGVAGIFDSLGNAAKNAGEGVKLMAQGIAILVNLKLGDLVGTLSAVATGIGAISAASGGLATAGAAIVTLVQGLAAMQAASSGVAMALSSIAAIIPSVSAAFAAMQASGSSSMLALVSVVRSSASQMAQAGQQAGRSTTEGIVNGIRSGIGQAGGAMRAMVIAIRDTGMTGVGMMRTVGAMISQGLAAGMMSALGAVTAAANALVAQAERAARAKAQIHSPSILFRDNVGRYIAQGIATGIEENTSDVTKSLGYVQDQMMKYRFSPEQLLSSGNGSITMSAKLKQGAERASAGRVEQIKDKADKLTQKALEIAEEAIKRPILTYLDGDTLVGGTGDRQKAYQDKQSRIYNRMRGIETW